LLRHWDEQPHIIAAKGTEDWQWEQELKRTVDWREQLIASTPDKAIGFVEIIDPAREDSHYWGDCPEGWRAIDIWIGEADCLGRGLGTAIMEAVIARCFAHSDVQALVIDPLRSNTAARRFYERLGFRFIENRRFGCDDCSVYKLDRPR